MTGKKVKLQPTPTGKAVSGNPNLTSDKRFTVIGIHKGAPKAWHISYEDGAKAGWVYEWEMADYFDLAKKYDYRVASLIVENRHGSNSIHNVPKEKLDMMKERFTIKLI